VCKITNASIFIASHPPEFCVRHCRCIASYNLAASLAAERSTVSMTGRWSLACGSSAPITSTCVHLQIREYHFQDHLPGAVRETCKEIDGPPPPANGRRQQE
jgi:hypothetical protein